MLPYKGLAIAAYLYDLKECMEAIISNNTDKWIRVGVPKEKRDHNIGARFWFGFIWSTIMPSQPELVLRLPKETFHHSIMSRKSINLGL